MFNLFNKRDTDNPGANLDERPQEEQEKDFTFDEIVAEADSVDWREKEEADWNKYPIFSQGQSGSCVAKTAVKMLGIMHTRKSGDDYFHFSATHVYQQRRNRPGSGMIATDCMNIVRKGGATLEDLVGSQMMTDKQMDNAKVENYEKRVGEIFKISNYVSIPRRDIDKVASVMQKTNKPVMVWFNFRRDEWGKIAVLKHRNLPASGRGVVRHSVTATDYFFYKGEKSLLIEDSWGERHGKGGRRIIPESFFKERNIYSGYFIDFAFEDQTQPQTNKPRHTFSRPLEFSATFRVDKDVVHLQNILKYEGLFPSNVSSTGYFGAITAKAVHRWQVKHQVAPLSELNALRGRRVGPKTIAKLNELYS